MACNHVSWASPIPSTLYLHFSLAPTPPLLDLRTGGWRPTAAGCQPDVAGQSLTAVGRPQTLPTAFGSPSVAGPPLSANGRTNEEESILFSPNPLTLRRPEVQGAVQAPLDIAHSAPYAHSSSREAPVMRTPKPRAQDIRPPPQWTDRLGLASGPYTLTFPHPCVGTPSKRTR